MWIIYWFIRLNHLSYKTQYLYRYNKWEGLTI